jgi:peptidoglycan/LPS O-acetylase OafA/YrhL
VAKRPPWSDRRRRTLLGLALAVVVCGLGAIALPGRFGVTAGILAVLCVFLLGAVAVVFVVVPGPDTVRTLLASVPLAGAVLVVAVLLLLSASAELRWLWSLAVAVGAVWTATAVWRARRTGGSGDGG